MSNPHTHSSDGEKKAGSGSTRGQNGHLGTDLNQWGFGRKKSPFHRCAQAARFRLPGDTGAPAREPAGEPPPPGSPPPPRPRSAHPDPLHCPPLAAPLGWDGAVPGEGGSAATGAGRAQAALSSPPFSTSCPRPLLLPRPRGGERSAGAARRGRRSRGRSVSAARRPNPVLGGTGRLTLLPCGGESHRGPRVRAPPPAAPRAEQSLPRRARGRWKVWGEGR